MPFQRSTIGDNSVDVTQSVDAPAAAVVTDAALREWIDGLHSPEPAVRSHALTRLQEYPDQLAALAPTLLREDESSVRITTLTALAFTTHRDLESWLVDVLESDPDVNVCAAAVELLGDIGTTASHDALEALPARFPDQPFVQFAVRVALERLTDV